MTGARRGIAETEAWMEPWVWAVWLVVASAVVAAWRDALERVAREAAMRVKVAVVGERETRQDGDHTQQAYQSREATKAAVNTTRAPVPRPPVAVYLRGEAEAFEGLETSEAWSEVETRPARTDLLRRGAPTYSLSKYPPSFLRFAKRLQERNYAALALATGAIVRYYDAPTRDGGVSCRRFQAPSRRIEVLDASHPQLQDATDGSNLVDGGRLKAAAGPRLGALMAATLERTVSPELLASALAASPNLVCVCLSECRLDAAVLRALPRKLRALRLSMCAGLDDAALANALRDSALISLDVEAAGDRQPRIPGPKTAVQLRAASLVYLRLSDRGCGPAGLVDRDRLAKVALAAGKPLATSLQTLHLEFRFREQTPPAPPALLDALAACDRLIDLDGFRLPAAADYDPLKPAGRGSNLAESSDGSRDRDRGVLLHQKHKQHAAGRLTNPTTTTTTTSSNGASPPLASGDRTTVSPTSAAATIPETAVVHPRDRAAVRGPASHPRDVFSTHHRPLVFSHKSTRSLLVPQGLAQRLNRLIVSPADLRRLDLHTGRALVALRELVIVATSDGLSRALGPLDAILMDLFKILGARLTSLVVRVYCLAGQLSDLVPLLPNLRHCSLAHALGPGDFFDGRDDRRGANGGAAGLSAAKGRLRHSRAGDRHHARLGGRDDRPGNHDRDVRAIARHCPGLRSVDLSNAHDAAFAVFSEAAVAHLVDRLHHLTDVYLYECGRTWDFRRIPTKGGRVTVHYSTSNA